MNLADRSSNDHRVHEFHPGNAGAGEPVRRNRRQHTSCAARVASLPPRNRQTLVLLATVVPWPCPTDPGINPHAAASRVQFPIAAPRPAV